jgi:O-succinylbenzoic acid--CoA ligase
MIGSARKTLSFFDLQPGDRALLCLPIRYIAGKMMVVRALVGGLDLVTVEPSGRPLKEVKGTFSFGAMVPLQVHESLKHGDELGCIGELIVGGGELHPELRKKMAFMERPALYESFAMTETYTHFALKRINGSSPDSLFCLMEGVRASQDERGCLVVEVEGVTGGPVTTNDLVEMDPSGKAFRWLGRLDHVISSGGIKIIPEILEQKISNCLGLECLVLPEPDVSLGSRLLLMVESPDRDPPEKKWLSLLRKDLMDHEIPKRIVTVLHIPRNASYKPDRRAALTLI